MGAKGSGGMVNHKAEEGRERKAAAKEVKKRKEQAEKQALEDKQWEVGSKARPVRVVEEESKRLEKLDKKKERQLLQEQEEAAMMHLKPIKPLPKEKDATKKGPTLQELKARMASSSAPSSSVRSGTVDTDGDASKSGCSSATSRAESFYPTSPASSSSRINGERLVSPRRDREEPQGTAVYSASNIDDALFLLESSSSVAKVGAIERHPERRQKAAYAAFEEREMPLLKQEHPGLRLSQLKERLHRMWQKSPDNPFNQAHISYKSTRSQELNQATSEIESAFNRLKIHHHPPPN